MGNDQHPPTPTEAERSQFAEVEAPDPAMEAFTKAELEVALDEALAREASTVVWMIVDEIERRDDLAEL